MKIALVILTFLFSNNVISQDSNFGVEINLSPGIGFRKLKNTEPDNEFLEFFVAERNKNEEPTSLFFGSVSAVYFLKPKIELMAGFDFSTFGNRAYNIQAAPAPAPVDEFESSILLQYYHFMGISLNSRFVLPIGTKFDLTVIIGTGLYRYFLYSDDFTFKYSSTEEFNQKMKTYPKLNELDKPNLWNVPAAVGLGIRYKLNRVHSLNLEPNYCHLLLPMYDTPVKGWFYKYGVNIGYTYRF